MVVMATCNANLKNGDVPTINYIYVVPNHSQLKLVPNKSIVTGLLSCGQIFKLSNLHILKWKFIKKNTVNKLSSAPNDQQTTILACFISSMIQFDKSFHPVVVYVITSFSYSRILMTAL